MFELTKWLLLILYAVTPVAAVVRVWWRQRQTGWPDEASPFKAAAVLSSAAGMAVALGAGLNFAYAYVAGASVRLGQIALTCYFLLSLILLLRGFNKLLQTCVERLFFLHHARGRFRYTRAFGAGMVRAALLFGVGLPLVMSSVMTYRPKVRLREDPQQQLGATFQEVSFVTDDDVTIAGWWIPAMDRFGQPAGNVTETVVVCHGLGANKSNQLTLAAHFVQAGFNVLIFDFRAHGQSGGQISSFGDLERRDVLAAVHWLKQTHPEQARKVYGVGASMGAAALIAAAADPSEEGLAIDAVAVYGTYDSLANLTRDVADGRFLPPLNWLTMHLSLPLASAHAGTNLAAFSPAALVDRVAPRPVLFIHGTEDMIIPFARGDALRDAASQPKYHLWIRRGDHNGIINDQLTGRIVAEFFRVAPQAL